MKQSAQFTHPEKNSYRHMLHRVIPQQTLDHPLGDQRLFAAGFRRALVGDGIKEMPYRPVEAALHQRALPTRHRLFQLTLYIFTQPVTHIGQLIQRAVGHRLHAFALAAAAAMHTGRHLRVAAGEVVLGVQHFACSVGP